MLISYGIKGLKSFVEYVDINMYSNNKLTEFNDSLFRVFEREALLPMMVLYGPNGAGKSNFLSVLSYIKASINDFTAFKESLVGVSDVIELQIELLVEGKKCAYNFEYSKLENKVVSEEFGINAEQYHCVYRLKDGCLVELSTEVFNTSVQERVKIYVEDLEQKSLLLAKLSKAPLFNESIMKMFSNYIIRDIQVLSYNDDMTPRYNITLTDENEKNKFLSDLVKFDSDIEDISEEVVNADDIKAEIPKHFYEKLMNELNSELPVDNSQLKRIMFSSRNVQIIIEKNLGKVKMFKYVYKLKGVSDNVDYSQLSDGTKAIIRILDTIIVEENNVFIIDELERSFHPLLLELLTKYLRKNSIENKNQFIMSTHNLNILDIKFFRRDEINFIEKTNAVSQVYNLNSYIIRKDNNLAKSYKNGRFGAIPNILDIEV